MSINTSIRLLVLSSAVALAAAAPSAFAMHAGTWQGGYYTDADGTPDAPAASFSKQVVDRMITPSSVATPITGKWEGNFYAEIGGTPDAPAARYSKQVIDKKVGMGTLSTVASMASTPAY